MLNYFLNFLIPIRAGEVVRSLLLKKIRETPVSKSLPTVYLDKIADIFPLIILLILSPFLTSQIRGVVYTVSAILFLLLVILISSLVFAYYRRDSAFAFIDKPLFFLSSKQKSKLRNTFTLFLEGLSSLSHLSNRLLAITSLTVLATILHCYFMWLFFYVFDITLPILTTLIGYTLLNISFALPAPPGFSGSLELTFLFIFSYLFPYDKNLVSAVAGSSHVFVGVFFVVLGLTSLSFIGVKLSTLFNMGISESSNQSDTSLAGRPSGTDDIHRQTL
jgi:uncharacterized protein (TIRG00374 family)